MFKCLCKLKKHKTFCKWYIQYVFEFSVNFNLEISVSVIVMYVYVCMNLRICNAKVNLWRRSYDIAPPDCDLTSDHHPSRSAKYQGNPEALKIRTESLKVFDCIHSKISMYVWSITFFCLFSVCAFYRRPWSVCFPTGIARSAQPSCLASA